MRSVLQPSGTADGRPVAGLARLSGGVAKAGRWTAWASAGSLTLAFVAQPVSVDAQIALACVVIACMTGVWIAGKGPFARMAFITLGSLIILRYVYWRATSTLPSWNEPLSFVIGLVLFAAELYCVGFLAINLIINCDPLDREVAQSPSDDAMPPVDVFVPSYNEDEDILAMTLSAAKLMDYPSDRLTVWLLDDGGTDQKCNDPDPIKAGAARARRHSLQVLCAQLGVEYSTRAANEHAKAGNLNSGLRKSKGEIVVVLDADHVPFRQFLRATVGYFSRDPKLFLVQTPHVFLNPDPIEKNLATFDRMPSENEMFYSITQRGLDKWNGSFFCGSAALLRRTALEQAGGFSGITITEDCETAFELHAKGWSSVYVDKPLIAGLQPETFASFIGQRSRWCQGMLQIMLLKNPALRRGLVPIQRLAYLSSMIFWLFPLPRLVFMFAPLFHIFFDVRIFVSSIDECIAYTASYVVANAMLQNNLYGRVRWPWMSELYEYVQGVFLARSILSVAISPRKPTFNVTAKGQSLDRAHLSKLAAPLIAIFIVLALGVMTAGYRYLTEPGITNLMLVVGLWATFNLAIAAAALGVVAERKQTDRFPRLAVDRRGVLTLEEKAIEVMIDNVSASGCAVRPCQQDEGIDVRHDCVGFLSVVPMGGGPSRGALPVRLTRYATSPPTGTHGLAFERMTARDYFLLADLMYGDASAIASFLDRRRRPMNLLRGSLRFLAWSFQGPVRALGYALLNRSAPRQEAAAAASAVPATSALTPVPVPAVAPAALVTPGLERGDWMRQMLELAAAEVAAVKSGRTDALARA